VSRGYLPEHFILVDIRAVVMFVQCNKFMHAWLKFSGGRDQVVQKRAAVCSMDLAMEEWGSSMPADLPANWTEPPVSLPDDISWDGHDQPGEPVSQPFQTPPRNPALPVLDLAAASTGATSSASRGSEPSVRRRLRTKTTPQRDPVAAAAAAAAPADQRRPAPTRYHIHPYRRAWCAVRGHTQQN